MTIWSLLELSKIAWPSPVNMMIYLYRKAAVRTTWMTKPWWNLTTPLLQFSKLSCKPKRTKTRKKVMICTQVSVRFCYTENTCTHVWLWKTVVFSSKVRWNDPSTWIIVPTIQHHATKPASGLSHPSHYTYLISYIFFSTVSSTDAMKVVLQFKLRYPSGVIVSQFILTYMHHLLRRSLFQWVKRKEVPEAT